jgi:hypothetical protein
MRISISIPSKLYVKMYDIRKKTGIPISVQIKLALEKSWRNKK